LPSYHGYDKIFATDEHGLTSLRQGYGGQARILSGMEETPLFSHVRGSSALAENHFSLSVPARRSLGAGGFISVHPWLIFFGCT